MILLCKPKCPSANLLSIPVGREALPSLMNLFVQLTSQWLTAPLSPSLLTVINLLAAHLV